LKILIHLESEQVIVTSAEANAIPRYPLFKDQQPVEYSCPLRGCQGRLKNRRNAVLKGAFTLNTTPTLAILRRSEVPLTNGRTIGVLAGGDSPERDVSLTSGSHVHQALIEGGYNASLVTIDSLDDLLPALDSVDTVFNCLHGGAGEDGTVQLLLDVVGIPYAGSGARACFQAMNKIRARAVFASQGIPTPEGLAYQDGDLTPLLDEAVDSLGFPMVAKPGAAGSTLGIRFAEDREQLREAADAILAEFSSLMVEQYIAGREITVGILRQGAGDAPLPVIEIRIPGPLFDYEAKYSDGVAEFLAPAPLDDETARRLQAVSLRAHLALGCAGYSRVDLRLAEDGTPYVLEVNTLPGMTPMSDLPRAAAVAGIPYTDLVARMLATADSKEVS
jgi:D-alanine-D-alanine ligase